MDRRAFIGAAAASLVSMPLAIEAQQSGKVPRLGYLAAPARSTRTQTLLNSFLQGLRDLGWVEGKDVAIEYRWADGRADRLRELAAELVRLQVDVIFATSTAVAVAAKNATSTIPIVVPTMSNPEELGLVASIARPGGNVTGLSYSAGLEIFGKQLELLKETVPKVRRVAILSNPANPGSAGVIRNVKVAAGRWDCSFSSSRPAVPTNSTAHSRRCPESGRVLFSWCRTRRSIFTEHGSRSLRQTAVCRPCTAWGPTRSSAAS